MQFDALDVACQPGDGLRQRSSGDVDCSGAPTLPSPLERMTRTKTPPSTSIRSA
jgi:hypothetical protein